MTQIIQDWIQKIKTLPRRFWDDVFLIVAIFLISLASFGMGRLSVIYTEPRPLEVVYPGGQEAAAVSATAETAAHKGQYVASINGTKYYLTSCGGASRINEENKIWFSTQKEAELAGYEPAANCPGL